MHLVLGVGKKCFCQLHDSFVKCETHVALFIFMHMWLLWSLLVNFCSQYFITGHALKPESSSVFSALMDQFKKLYVTQIKGFDVHKMCVVTLLLEGTKEVCASFCTNLYLCFCSLMMALSWSNLTRQQ